MSIKACIKCGFFKPHSDFSILKRAGDGLNYICKPCKNIASKEYRENNRDHISKYNKEYREKNSTILKAKQNLNPIEKVNNKKVRRLLHFQDAENLVRAKGGTMLSDPTDYKTAHSKLKIKCNNNHIFLCSKNNLNHNNWCPQCNIYIGELISVQAIEHLMEKPFIKIRPDWLINPETNSPLELDGYNDELKLAIEYNGIQHYNLVKNFHKTEDDLKKIQERDRIKRELCIDNKVHLITVPYTVDNHNICQFIADHLQKNNYQINNCEEKIKNFKIDNSINYESKVDKIRQIIKEKEGILLNENEVFYSPNFVLKIQCKLGHQWETKTINILRNSWCTTCGVNVKEETKSKISQTLKEFNSTEEGKKIKKASHNKRSQTMEKEKETLRQNLIQKRCSKCGITKGIENFNKKKDSKDGYQPWCKECYNLNKKMDSKNKKIKKTKVK